MRDQERRYGGASDDQLYNAVRDAFVECAAILTEGKSYPRRAINDAYRRSGEARAMLEVIARRWMQPTERNREESDG